MSRVAKKPITLPKGVECQVKSDTITVKGPKGSRSMAPLRGVAGRCMPLAGRRRLGGIGLTSD